MNGPREKKNETYTDEETQRRFEATLKGALKAPPKSKSAADGKAPRPPRGPGKREK